MLWMVPLAAAHLPHDDVVTVAMSAVDGVHLVAALQASGSQRVGPWALLRWEGAGWDPIAVPPTTDQPVGLAWIGDQIVLLDSGGALWTGPAPWGVADGPTGTSFRSLTVLGDTVYVAADTGLWSRATSGGAWTALTTRDTAWAGADEVHVAAVGGDGSLWLDAAELPSLAGAVAMATDGSFAATSSSVYRLDETWQACAPLPVSDVDPEDQAEIVALAADGDTVIVGTGQWVYRSTDACASWVEEHHVADSVTYGSADGSIDSADRACTGVWLRDGVAVVSGNRGVAVDEGAGWASGRLLDATWLRDVAHVGSTWYSASYGAAVVVDDAGVMTQAGLDLPQSALFGRYIDPIDEERLVYCGDIDAYWSGDGGATFSTLSPPFASVGATAAVGGAGWVFEAASAGTGVARTTDGVTWTSVVIGTGAVRDLHGAVVDGVHVLLARAMNPDQVSISPDAGTTWSALVDDGDPLTALVAWPEDEGRRLVRAADVVRLSDDGGATWRDVSGGPSAPNKLAVDGDVIYAVDVEGIAWASTDGGETWSEGSWAGAVVAELLVVDGRLYAPTLRGLRWSEDGGITWSSFPTLDTLTPKDADLECVSPSGTGCRRVGDLELEALDEVAFWTRASSLRFLGTGTFAVSVDGVGLDEIGAGEALVVPGSGWHRVQAVAEGGATIDEVVGIIAGDRPPEEEEEPTPEPASRMVGVVDEQPVLEAAEACGCGSARSPGVAGLLVLVALRRRKGSDPAH